MFFNNSAHCMPCTQVHLLNACRVVRGYGQAKIRMQCHGAASLPAKAMVRKPSSRAFASPLSTLGDLPLVLKPQATSPGLPRASIGRENISLNCKIIADAGDY